MTLKGVISFPRTVDGRPRVRRDSDRIGRSLLPPHAGGSLPEPQLTGRRTREMRGCHGQPIGDVS